MVVVGAGARPQGCPAVGHSNFCPSASPGLVPALQSPAGRRLGACSELLQQRRFPRCLLELSEGGKSCRLPRALQPVCQHPKWAECSEFPPLFPMA